MLARLPARPRRALDERAVQGRKLAQRRRMHSPRTPTWRTPTPELEQELLEAIGVDDVEELFEQIPAEPPPARRARTCRRRSPPRSTLRRHLLELAAHERRPASETLSFLGGGCWQHHVPAICDEIVAPQRVPHAGLGHAVVRPRAEPGLVRVREPARRADRHGLRRPARLQLGLRGRARDPHGGAHHRPPRGARARRRSTPSASPSSAPTASRPRWPATSTSCSSTTTPRRAGSTSPTSSASSPPRTAAVLLREPVVPRA